MIELQNIWPEWQIEELIGQGAYGKVYRIRREHMGKTSYAALKLIEIPADDAEVKNLLRLGMDNLSIRDYFTDTARAITDEISTMQDLQSASNVVIVEDYHLEEHKDGIGWTILIRMELLTSLPDYQRDHGDPDTEETVKIGIDICKALESCESCRIIHRDVKPQNVFRNKFGDYKLGDFGIARKMEDTKSAYSQKGTEGYMAPEIVHGEKYDSTVDIYSLGIMLYEFLNGQRMPFLPTGTTKLKPSDFQTAMERRLSGEELPAPKEADPMLSKIILKACSANPQMRYRHAKQFREALEAWQEGKAGQTVELPQEGPVIKPVHWGGADAVPHPVPENAEKNQDTESPNSEKHKPEVAPPAEPEKKETIHSSEKTSSGETDSGKNRKAILIAATAALIVIAAIAAAFGAGKKKSSAGASGKSAETTAQAASSQESSETLPEPILSSQEEEDPSSAEESEASGEAESAQVPEKSGSEGETEESALDESEAEEREEGSSKEELPDDGIPYASRKAAEGKKEVPFFGGMTSEGTMDPVYLDAIDVHLPKCEFVNPGFQFAGWTKESSMLMPRFDYQVKFSSFYGANTVFEDLAVVNAKTFSNRDTLIAMWKVDPETFGAEDALAGLVDVRAVEGNTVFYIAKNNASAPVDVWIHTDLYDENRNLIRSFEAGTSAVPPGGEGLIYTGICDEAASDTIEVYVRESAFTPLEDRIEVKQTVGEEGRIYFNIKNISGESIDFISLNILSDDSEYEEIGYFGFAAICAAAAQEAEMEGIISNTDSEPVSLTPGQEITIYAKCRESEGKTRQFFFGDERDFHLPFGAGISWRK